MCRREEPWSIESYVTQLFMVNFDKEHCVPNFGKCTVLDGVDDQFHLRCSRLKRCV